MECYPDAWTDWQLQPYEAHKDAPYVAIPFGLIDPNRGNTAVRMCPNRLALIMRDLSRPKEGLTTSYGYMSVSKRWILDDRSKPRAMTVEDVRSRSLASEKQFDKYLKQYDVLLPVYRS